MEVADQWYIAAEIVEAASDFGNFRRRHFGVDSNADDFRSLPGQGGDLLCCRLCIGCIGVGHRLDHDRRIAADRHGDPDARAVVFLHGGGQTRRSWGRAAGAVAERGWQAVTVDLRGHGESDWAADGDYLLEAYGRDVESIIQAFDRPIALVGASRGGQSALVGGSRRADLVRLIMLAAVAPCSPTLLPRTTPQSRKGHSIAPPKLPRDTPV